MKKSDLYWLAGILEGEGSFLKGPPSKPNQPLIKIEMTDKDVIVRVSKIFGIGYYFADRKPYKRVYRTILRGSSAVVLMRKLYPLMGIRRKDQITKAIHSYRFRLKIKLDRRKYAEIKQRLAVGDETHAEIAKRFGIDRSCVSHINRGRKWSWKKHDASKEA